MTPKYKNILLINPWYGDVLPIPAIGYLQAAIKSYFGDQVNVKARDITDALTILHQESFDLVGVSFHSLSVKEARLIRNSYSGHLICGGHHPSALPQQMLDIGYDQVVIGEGENAVIDIILGETNPLVYETTKYFTTINDIPFPDYTGLNYGKDWGLPIITSRGCPFQCNFCASSDFWGRKWYPRSPDNILAEIKQRLDNGMVGWIFEDDNFTLDKNRAKEICRRIISEITPVYGIQGWQCASRAESLSDPELCQLLHDAGCFTIWTGIETLSQSALDRCKKGTTLEKIRLGLENALNYGLNVICQFIIGLPGDTEADMIETSKNIKLLKIPRTAFNYAWILPNTEIHRQAKLRGFSDESYLTGADITYTYEQSWDTLHKWDLIVKTY
jgi:radical SAM superfamily enzyme YgiQ (UPF0313 family)